MGVFIFCGGTTCTMQLSQAWIDQHAGWIHCQETLLVLRPQTMLMVCITSMEQNASQCCGPPCPQVCNACTGNFLKHLGKQLGRNPCHPCAAKGSSCRYPHGLNEVDMTMRLSMLMR